MSVATTFKLIQGKEIDLRRKLYNQVTQTSGTNTNSSGIR